MRLDLHEAGFGPLLHASPLTPHPLPQQRGSLHPSVYVAAWVNQTPPHTSSACNHTNTDTHCDLQNTLTACPRLCPPFFSQIIKSLPHTRNSAVGSGPQTTIHCHLHVSQPIRGPWVQSPSPDNYLELSFCPQRKPLYCGQQLGHPRAQTLDLVSVQGGGQREEKNLGGEEDIPSKVKVRHTKRHHTPQASNCHQKSQELLQIMCYFLKIRVRCQIYRQSEAQD